MADTSDPNIIVGELALSGLAIIFLWRFMVWAREIPTTPDPWGEEIEKKLHEPEAVEICHLCLTPQHSHTWFCEHCGSAVGPYNNWMPYVCIFSQGEVLRNGVTNRLRASPLIIIGYLVYSLFNYFVFAPIYWFFLFKNLQQHKDKSKEIKESIE
jgi:hypothetical protein